MSSLNTPDDISNTNNAIDTHHFDILYGKSKDAKIKMWKITVEKYNNYSEIVTLYGYNRKIETRRRINTGKNINKSNQTNHYEQAILEATSKWNKKISIENYSTIHPENLIETYINTPTIELLKNITINEPKNVVVFPMLAQDFNVHKNKVKYPCFIQPKLDGYRMIYNTSSKECTTRQGKSFNIIKQSGTLYRELCSLPDGYILDGELYVHNNENVSFETLGVLRKTKNLTLQDKQNLSKIEYHVYDVIDTQLTYHHRKKLLDTLINTELNMIKNVITFEIHSENDIKTYHNRFVNDNGYEGSMIRSFNGVYKEKFRSHDLLKLKNFMDAEFEIVDYTFEKDTSGADKNLIIWIIQVKENIQCKVRPKGTKEQRQKLYSDCQADFSKFKHKKLWTKFFEYTADGNLRFPTTKTNDVSTYIRNEII